MAMFPDRRSKALAIALSCVIAIVCFGTLYVVGDLARFQQVNMVRESQVALRGVNDPQQLDQSLRRYPANSIVKLVALANRDSGEIDAAARGLLNEADPGELWGRMGKASSSRGDLEALGRDLKAAEINTAALDRRYSELAKVARDKVEHDAGALEEGGNDVAKFMAMIDEQHAGLKANLARTAAVRLEYFGAYQTCVALLAREFGLTKVVNGQFIFRLQPLADSYNAAAATMASAAKRLAELDAEREAESKSRLDRWKSFAGG